MQSADDGDFHLFKEAATMSVDRRRRSEGGDADEEAAERIEGHHREADGLQAWFAAL